MEMDGLKLVSRFSLPPNSLGHCGKDSAPEKFKKCVSKDICKGVKEEIENFIVLNPYLETISQVINSPKFSHKTVEAYWLGNDELKKISDQDYEILLKNFSHQRISELLIQELKKSPPKKFTPTHLFQILHTGVGRASNSVPYNLKTINSCMIRWGEVKEISNKNIIVELNSLKEEKGNFKLIKKEEKAKTIPEFVPKIKYGDIAAVHWGQIIKILTQEEKDKISFWTKKVLSNI